MGLPTCEIDIYIPLTIINCQCLLFPQLRYSNALGNGFLKFGPYFSELRKPSRRMLRVNQGSVDFHIKNALIPWEERERNHLVLIFAHNFVGDVHRIT